MIFKNGAADRITIYKFGKYLEFNERLIQTLGLSQQRPSFSNRTVIRWEDVEGFDEISFFNNGYNKVDYILVQLTEPD